MQMAMKISLVTATYNSSATIAATLDSVLAQTYKDIEYWIIDGSSIDSTMEIVSNYEPLFNGRLHYLSEPDKGLYDAMNKGLSLCTGDVVGFLNSDDHYTSDDILEMVAEKINDVDAVYGDVHFVRAVEPSNVIRYYSSAMFRPFWLRFGFMPAHPSFYARREIYEKVGGFSLDYKIAADFELMVRLFYVHKIKTRYVKKDFVTMLTGGMSTRSMANRILITKEDVKACRQNGLYTNILMVSCKYLYKVFEFKIWK